MIDIQQILKDKISDFITNHNITATKNSQVPVYFQKQVLENGLDDFMVEIFILSLIDDKETLKSFLSEDLYYSKEFQQYCNNILGIA